MSQSDLPTQLPADEPPPPVDADSSPEKPEPKVGPDIDFTDPNSPLAPYYFQTSHVLAVALVVGVFIFFNIAPLGHSDIWGHLKFGEWIVQNGRLPDHEPFSPNADPAIAVPNFAWLTQAMLYQTFRAGAWLAGGGPLRQTEGGIDLLRFAHALCEALKAVFLLLAFRRFSGSLPLAIAGVILVFVFSLAPSSIQRPQAFGETLFAVLLWLVARPLTDAAAATTPWSWRRIAGIALTLVLWANVHGSFLIGIALVGLIWLGGVVESLRENGIAATMRSDACRRPIIALVAGVIMLSLLNPHGPRAIFDVLKFGSSPNIRAMREWQPMEFTLGPGGHWGYLAILILILATQLISPRIFRPTQLLLLFVFGIGPLFQERLMTWWAMLMPVILLPAWADLGWFANSERWTSVLSLRKTILAAGFVLLGIVWSNLFQLATGHPPTSISVSANALTLWPITGDVLAGRAAADAEEKKALFENPLSQALAEQIKNYPGGQFRGAIFTPEAMGDYLVWSLPPKAPVMVYSHVHFFPPRFWDDYMEILFGFRGWKTSLDKHNVNLVICQVEGREKLLERLSEDPDWVVFLDQSEQQRNRPYRLFAAIRKKPLGAAVSP